MVLRISQEEHSSSFLEDAHMEHYHHLCHLTCNNLTNGDMTKAEDLVQEAFTRALKYQKEDLDNVAGYLWRVITRVHITQWRKEHEDICDSIDDPANEGLAGQLPSTKIEQDILEVIENDRLRRKFHEHKGPLTEREDFLLTSHLDGYSNREIATELGEKFSDVSNEMNKLRNRVMYRLRNPRTKKTKAVTRKGSLLKDNVGKLVETREQETKKP